MLLLFFKNILFFLFDKMDSTQNLGLFVTDLTGFIDLKQGNQLTQIVCYKDDTIIYGDDKGTIEILTINDNKKDKQHGKKTIENYKIKSVGKNKINKLIVINELNILYVLSGLYLHAYLLPGLDDKNAQHLDFEITNICRNLKKNNEQDLLLIIKKPKKIKLYTFEIELMKLIPNKNSTNEFPIEDTPEYIEWYGNYICYFLKKTGTIYFIDLSKNDTQTLPYDCSGILFLNESWLTASMNIGLLFETNGNPKTIEPITLEDKPFKQFGRKDNYLLTLYDTIIVINDGANLKKVQQISIEIAESQSKGICLINGEKKVFILIKETSDKDKEKNRYILRELKETPFEEQLSRLLKVNKFDEALSIINNKISVNEDKIEQFENYYLGCAWAQFSKEEYETAKKFFQVSNFNPFELMYLFINLLKVKPIHIGYEKNNNILDNQIELKDNNEEKVKKAVKCLIDVLKSKIEYVWREHRDDLESGKFLEVRTLSFNSSTCSIINLSDCEPKDINLKIFFQNINLTLLKALVFNESKVEEIRKLIENDNFGTDFLSDKFFDEKNTDYSKLALAFIYEKKQNYKDALKILKEFVQRLDNPSISQPSKQKTINILLEIGKQKDKQDLFEEHIQWMLKQYQTDAFDIVLSNELMPIDYFMNQIIPKVENEKNDLNAEPTNYIKEKFLRHICDNPKYSKYSNEKYQTQLILLQLETLFKDKPKNYTPAEGENLPGRYHDFRELLKKYNLFDKMQLIDKIKDSWLYDIEIDLYCELEKLDDALITYIDLVNKNRKKYSDIEQFCMNNLNKDNRLFIKFFKNLSSQFKDESTSEEKKEMIKNEMLKIMDMSNKHELTKEKKNSLEILNLLNPNEVLNEIPDEWTLEEEIVFKFLRNSLMQYTNVNNEFTREEGLLRADLNYKQLELFRVKNRHVNIDIGTVCNGCKKKIGTTIFVVYPNNAVYHTNCAPNPYIEPRKGTDFTNFKY